jgi:ferric-dicitrate binding protein FerR (iron transport regulator)
MEGRLTDGQRKELNRRLREDEGDRRRFAAVLRQEVLLGEILREEAEGAVSKVTTPAPLRRERRRLRASHWILWGSVAAALLIAAGLYFFLVPGDGAPRQRVLARVEPLGGSVVVLRGSRITRVSGPLALYAGDQIKTGEHGEVTIAYIGDETRIELEDQTQIELLAKVKGKAEGKHVKLRKGVLQAQIAPQPAGRNMIFTTPHAAVEVLGTRLFLSVTEKVTRVDVARGLVKLVVPHSKVPVTVAQGFYAVAAGDAEPVARPLPARTVSFQDGVSPSADYGGTRDASIKERYPAANFGAAGQVRADGQDDSREADGVTFDTFGLLRWEIAAIPEGSTVLSASITVTINRRSPHEYRMYEGRRPWKEMECSWEFYAAGQRWEAAGALGPGDRGSGVLGVIPAVHGKCTIDLTAAGIAVVQSWVDDPSSNHGVIVAEPDNPHGVAFRSKEHGWSVHDRPVLTIKYVPCRHQANGGRYR